MPKRQLRKTAYEYIKTQIGQRRGVISDDDFALTLPLDELMLLKEGQADPSSELVISIKQILRGSITEAEIEAHLVAPFQPH
jgi:hypothetical protein